PAALISAAASFEPAAADLPIKAAGPDSISTSPIRISLSVTPTSAAAAVPASSAASTAPATLTVFRFISCHLRWLSTLAFDRASRDRTGSLGQGPLHPE